MAHVKTEPIKHNLIPETVLPPASVDRRTGRFQVIVEYAAGVCISTAFVESCEEAVETFMKQSPGYENGEISLMDRDEQRVVAAVKWKKETTENGLNISYRQNVFNDWNLAMIALAMQNQCEGASCVKLSS